MCYFAKPHSQTQTSSCPLGLKLKTKDSKRTFSARQETEIKDFTESRSTVKSNEPVEILPHLYLGSEIHSSQKELLERLGITDVVNVSRNIPNFFEETFHYKSIPVDDTYTADIGRWFEEAAVFIGKIKNAGLLNALKHKPWTSRRRAFPPFSSEPLLSDIKDRTPKKCFRKPHLFLALKLAYSWLFLKLFEKYRKSIQKYCAFFCKTISTRILLYALLFTKCCLS